MGRVLRCAVANFLEMEKNLGLKIENQAIRNLPKLADLGVELYIQNVVLDEKQGMTEEILKIIPYVLNINLTIYNLNKVILQL